MLAGKPFGPVPDDGQGLDARQNHLPHARRPNISGMLDSWRPSGLDIPVQPDVTLTVAKSHGCGYGIEKNMSQVFPSRDRKHATVKA